MQAQGLASVDLSCINPDLHILLHHAGLDGRFVRGEGTTLQYGDGVRVLDFVAGFGALPLGHNPAEVHEAIVRGLADNSPNLIQPHFPDATISLAERLLALAGGGFQRVVFSNSGAEAVEVALKAARMASDRHDVLAMSRGFHGKTRGAMAVTDMRGRDVWSGKDDGTVFAPMGDVEALEEIMAARGDTFAAVIAEPVQGEGGIHDAAPEFFQRCRALCDQYGAFMVIDEVQTGFGRTGTTFAVDWLGITPDALTVGKALGGGVAPMAATFLSAHIATWCFSLQHSSTFAGNKLAALAAHGFLDVLERDKFALLANVRARSQQIAAHHNTLLRDFPDIVREHRGVGLLRGIEIGFDEPLVPGRRASSVAVIRDQGHLPMVLAGRLLQEGVRLAPTLRQSMTLRVEPPLNVSAAEVECYGRAMARVLHHMQQRDSARMLTHIVGQVRRKVDSPLDNADELEPVEPREGEGHFAFILHPLTERSMVEFDPGLGALTKDQLRTLSRSYVRIVRPFRVSRVRLKGRNGATAIGDFVVVPLTAEQLLQMPGDEAVATVQDAVDLAVEGGAQVIGLGGYTSVVTLAGRMIDARGRAVTNGNNYTMLAAIKAADLASEMLGVQANLKIVAIVGATGSIGSGLIGLAGRSAKRLILCVNPDTPVEKSRRRLTFQLANALGALRDGLMWAQPGSALSRFEKELSGASDHDDLMALAGDILSDGGARGIDMTSDLDRSLPQADLVFVATSSTETFIQPHMLRSGSVVCDLSRPGNTSYQSRDERPDVLMIDGGIVAFPGRPELGIRIGMPRGIGFACMAETAMLGLMRDYSRTRVGVTLDFAYIARLENYAAELGFELADLRSFDRPLGWIDWAKVKSESTNRRLARARRNKVPELEDSIGLAGRMDFYQRMIGEKLARRGDDVALVSAHGDEVAWRVLDTRAGAIAARLVDRGVRPGDRVVASGSNTPELVCAIAALWRIGAAPVLVDCRLETHMLRTMSQSVGAKLALVDTGHRAKFGSFLNVLSTEELAASRALGDAPPRSRARSNATVAVVTFTSGSTGQPKAVAHSVRDLVNTSVNYGTHVARICSSDRVLTVSRLSFTYGFNVLQMVLWHGAAAALAPDSFDADATLERIEAQRPTILFGVPTVYKLLLRKATRDYTTDSLRLCVSAGEPLPPSVADGWLSRRGLQLVDGLGTTEAISTFISNLPEQPSAAHMGRLVPGFELELRRADGSLAQFGEVGVAWVRGNTVSQGYLNDPENSKRFFVDGWYMTNDMLRQDAEGNYYYLGRANDMIKVSGVWLSPLQIESVLQDHPAVSECAVVIKEDEPPLVRPYAVVCLVPGVPQSEATRDMLKSHVVARLSRMQAPHEIFFLPVLPRTVNQKIERYRLSEMIDEELLGQVAPDAQVEISAG